MHEPYDDHDDEYDDDQYDHDHPSNPYQWYYKFDVGPNTPMSSWLSEMINKWIGPNTFNNLSETWGMVNVPGFPAKKFPVNSWNPNTVNNKFQYLGSNYQGNPIWKTQYFAIDKINLNYKLHIQAHAKHFVTQPYYYNGMFDILN